MNQLIEKTTEYKIPLCFAFSKTNSNTKLAKQARYKRTDGKGFRKDLHTKATAIIRLHKEYKIPLCLAFSKTNSKAKLAKQARYKRIDGKGFRKDLHTKATAIIRLHKDTEKINTVTGVRQGDTISPKLFTACLEEISRRLSWEGKSLKIMANI